MKRSLSLLASILLCTGIASANELTPQAGAQLDESVVDMLGLAKPEGGDKLMTSVDEQATDDQMKTQAYCYAWTTCYDGRRISCYARGQYCRWAYKSGRYVYCSATSYGRTRWVRYTCY